MLFLPEIKLQKICDAFLNYLKDDLKIAILENKEVESYLYLLFHENYKDLNNSTYYIQAKQIFLREESDNRLLVVRPIFDKSRANLPTIHVIIPLALLKHQ